MLTSDVKNLREQTGAGVMDAKRALEEAGGDLAKAVKIIQAKGLIRAEKRIERATSSGLIVSCLLYTSDAADE